MNPFVIIVDRYKKAKDWTVSKFSFSGKFQYGETVYEFKTKQAGYGIEDEVRGEKEVKVWGETAIPSGTYAISLTHSPKFSKQYMADKDGNIIETDKRTTQELKDRYSYEHDLFLINGIPGFSRVLIHWGNTDDDSAGCYIVGSYEGTKNGQAAVLESRKKYKEIYPIIWRAIRSGADVKISFN